MQTFLHSASAVMLILLMTAVGYFSGRMGWMKHEHKAFLVKYIMNIAMPGMCVSGLMGKVDRELLFSMRTVLLISICSIILLLVIALPVCALLKLPRRRRGVFLVMCCAANSMFIGYPMCTALFGDTAIPYVLSYYIVNTFFFQLGGVALLNASGSGEGERPDIKSSLRRLIKPPICTIVVCITLILCNVHLPDLVMRFASYMGNTVSPIALLYTGFVIYEMGFSHIRYERGVITALCFRFILAPLACLLFCHLFGLASAASSVLIIEMSMPVMTQAVVLSAECGADEGYAALGMTASTIFCFAAIPVLTALLT